MLTFACRTFCTLVVTLLFLSTARGRVFSLPGSVQDIVSASSLVVVGRLKSYKCTEVKKTEDQLTDDFVHDAFFGTRSNQKAGTYSFNIVSRIKGSCGSEITLDLPQIL